MKINQVLFENQILSEANPAAKILKDPKTSKMLSIAMRNDHTLPKHLLARLGRTPQIEDLVNLWGEILDKTLSNTAYGNLSQGGKFDDWLTRLYTDHLADFEDINGEGGDALGAWAALSKRGLLKPQDQDFNRFKSLGQLRRAISNADYRAELKRIQNAAEIEKMKREKKDVVIVDNDRYYVVIPLNYGACYTFNNAVGYTSNFCTGSSSGATWFARYAPEGMIVSIIDKSNMNSAEGKWQFHAPTHQLVDSDQTRRHDWQWNDQRFAKLFPGLMKEIVQGIETHAEEIKQNSQDIRPGGYDIPKEVALIKQTYPVSYASSVEDAQAQQ